MGKTIEGITVTVHMPKVVLNMNLTPTQGSYTFDPVTKVEPLKIKNEQVFSVVSLVIWLKGKRRGFKTKVPVKIKRSY